MSKNAYIKLVEKSTQQEITLNEVKNLFSYYKEITGKLGSQLSWEYEEAAFPYELKEQNQAKGQWFYLSSTKERYRYIVVGVSSESIEENEEQAYIQVTLPEGATHGDKGKANEFCKFLAKKLNGELHLFNGRIMYFYKR